jgi:hypothetical protein
MEPVRSDEKKDFAAIRQLEDTRDHSPDSDLKNETQNEFSPAEQRSILRRIDKRLVITVGVMYCVSLMGKLCTYVMPTVSLTCIQIARTWPMRPLLA